MAIVIVMVIIIRDVFWDFNAQVPIPDLYLIKEW